jgi:hypothetical protein
MRRNWPFFKANVGDLSPTFLRQLKLDIIAEKKNRRGAKAHGSGKQPTGQSSVRQPGSAGGLGYALPKVTRNTVRSWVVFSLRYGLDS